MRDRNLVFIQFCKEVEVFIRRKLKTLSEETQKASPRKSDPPFERLRFHFPSRKLIDLQGLFLISFFLPEIQGWAIRMELWEKCRYYSKTDQLRLLPFCENLGVCLTYLYVSDQFSFHDIFGNLIERGFWLLKNSTVYSSRTKLPKELIRRRGYKDKGSLNPSGLRNKLTQFDFSLTNLQNEEETRNRTFDTCQSRLKAYLLETYFKLLKD